MTDGCQNRRWPDLTHLQKYDAPQTWRSPLSIRKAGEDDPETYRWLLAIADRLMPRVRKAFLDAVERIRSGVDEPALRQALESGSVDEVLRVLNLDAALPAELGPALTKPLEDAFIEAGRGGAERVSGELGMRFDLTRPASNDFLASYDMGLIRQVSDETRLAVRRVVADAFQFGGHPKQQAREIRQFIGLTDRQTQAVLNYRDGLVADERPADQIERMVERYRQKSLRLRAESIARTETIRASNQGALSAWEQAADKGLISRSAFRTRWLVTPDDRLCIYCAAIPALNVDGRKLGEQFTTPLGPVSAPPLHPNCRCVLLGVPG